MRTVYCKGCVPPCRLRTSSVKAVSSTTVAPRVRTLWKIFPWTVRWESPKEWNVGREQLARWRCARPLAPLHVCPAAGVICGTAHVHRGVRLQKDPLKSSCQVRVEVSPCCVELHSRRSCCVSHQRVKMSVLLLRIKKVCSPYCYARLLPASPPCLPWVQWTVRYSKMLVLYCMSSLVIYCIHSINDVCMLISSSQFLPTSIPPWYPYICSLRLSLSALQTIPSTPFFEIPHIWINIYLFFWLNFIPCGTL